jgi:hypothetical protein
VEEQTESPFGTVREAPPGYRTQSEDTSYAVERFLFERWRAMEPHEKAAIVTLCRIGLAERWPHADEGELDLRLAAIHAGREAMIRAVGFDPDLETR